MSNHRHPGAKWTSGAGSGPAFGCQNVADHQNAIEFGLATKTEEAPCSEYQQRILRLTQSDPNSVRHLIEASLDVYYARALLDLPARAHQKARRQWDTWAFFRRSTEKPSSPSRV
jgi:hypothetical protein